MVIRMPAAIVNGSGTHFVTAPVGAGLGGIDILGPFDSLRRELKGPGEN